MQQRRVILFNGKHGTAILARVQGHNSVRRCATRVIEPTVLVLDTFNLECLLFFKLYKLLFYSAGKLNQSLE